mgnify:CR=1 FL=1
MRPAHIRNTCILVCAVLSVAACSTTRRLGSDEVLYTGVKKIRIEPDSGVVLSAAAESAVKEPLSVAPNNPLYSPYIRTPLPIGLWAYNYLYTPRQKGFKYWLFKRLAKQPVLISKVQPRLHAEFNEKHQVGMPHLAALICASAFDIALHDAFGLAHRIPTYRTYNRKFMEHDLCRFFGDRCCLFRQRL